jgi:hypothetical protein
VKGNVKMKCPAAFFIAFLFCSGCALVEKTGQMLDGSAFAQKRTALYRVSEKDGAAADMEISVVENRTGAASEAGAQSVIITIKKFPMIKFSGSFPDENGGFYLTSLEYLAGSVHGWNEYTLDIVGAGSLVLGETAVLEISEEIEPVQITAGRIQRYDTRITGNEALISLRNRRERIAALAVWMESIDAPSGQTIRDFENYWKPVLFPEMVVKRKRPSGWRQPDDQFQRAEDIRWNTGYTERVFSEELRPVRNSGTLLRDWEEALSWIYLEYEWDSIMELFSRQIIFQKIK